MYRYDCTPCRSTWQRTTSSTNLSRKTRFRPRVLNVRDSTRLPAPFVGVLSARKPHFERPAAIPQPMLARGWDHGNPLVAHCCIEIHAADSLQKSLFKKPLLHPRERRIIVLHSDYHGGLAHDPLPDTFGNG